MSDQWEPPQSELHSRMRGLGLDDVAMETRAVSSRLDNSRYEGRSLPVVPPIQSSVTYRIPNTEPFGAFEDIFDKGGYFYSRFSNPTIEACEAAISSLEGGAGTLCFSSGVAAIHAVLTALTRPGDHVVSQNPVYSGTHKILKKHLVKWGVESTFLPPEAGVEDYRRAVRPNTKVLYAETPCNPLINVTDLEAFGRLGAALRAQGVVTVVDSTYASPYLLRPIDQGVDIALHSGTKYLGGHLDLIAGVVTTRTREHWQLLSDQRSCVGNMLSPWDSFMMLRGVRSLHVRMDRHCDNAERVAAFLAKHPKVAKVTDYLSMPGYSCSVQVYYPGLTSDPGHAIAAKQMKRFGGMVTFDLKGGHAGHQDLHQGGVNSLIEHVTVMSHGKWVMTSEDRESGHLSDGLLRFSVGLEHIDDILKDLEQALAQVGE